MERRGGYTGGRLDDRGATKGGRKGPRGDGSMVYYYHCKELGHTKYQCPF